MASDGSEKTPTLSEMVWFLHRLWVGRHEEHLFLLKDRAQIAMWAWHVAVNEALKVRAEHRHHVRGEIRVATDYTARRVISKIYEVLKDEPLLDYQVGAEPPEWIEDLDYEPMYWRSYD